MASRNAPLAGRVMRLPISGDGEPEVVARSTEVPSGIVVDETHVYFGLELTGKVVRVPK